MNFLGLLVESYGTWLLLQRLVDASKDSDIPKNVPFAFAINNRNIIRGPVTDHELDQFCKERLKLRKAGGPDKTTNDLFRSLTSEELDAVVVYY